MTVERKCVACGVDADAMRAEVIRYKKLLLAVDRAFDPTSKAPWPTQSALRQDALAAIKAVVTGSIQ